MLFHTINCARFAVCRISKRFASTRLFTEKHEWVSIENKVGRVGISQHAQEALGDVVYVQLPEIGEKFAQFDEVGAIESVKAASELTTPVSGEILKINEKLATAPSVVNADCYNDGWLFEIKLNDEKELDKLMNEEQYNSFLRS